MCRTKEDHHEVWEGQWTSKSLESESRVPPLRTVLALVHISVAVRSECKRVHLLRAEHGHRLEINQATSLLWSDKDLAGERPEYDLVNQGRDFIAIDSGDVVLEVRAFPAVDNDELLVFQRGVMPDIPGVFVLVSSLEFVSVSYRTRALSFATDMVQTGVCTQGSPSRKPLRNPN